ncbi:hypothetical protein, partial [Vibrio pelagius]|uniref:hypothetical protein n=1 Tax=Vibrio pelagius TaxID=28169 RepID=UPI00354B4EE0
MDPILYIEVGGVVWQVFPDGTWLVLPPSQPKVDGVQSIEITNESIEARPLTEQQIREVEQQLDQVVIQLVNNAQAPASFDSSAQDESSNSASFVAYVRSTLEETLADAGYDTRPAEEELADQSEDSDSLDALLPSARLTVDILDGGDGYENQFEVPAVDIKGTAVDVRDGRTVEITITDVNDDTIVVTAITSNEGYEVNGLDISELAEGELSVEAVITDIYGSSINAFDSTIKDTLASIDVDFDGFGDEYYNQAEVSNGALVG